MGYTIYHFFLLYYFTLTNAVVNFLVFKANETGSSHAMELEGAKRCSSYLKKCGLVINTLVSGDIVA